MRLRWRERRARCDLVSKEYTPRPHAQTSLQSQTIVIPSRGSCGTAIRIARGLHPSAAPPAHTLYTLYDT